MGWLTIAFDVRDGYGVAGILVGGLGVIGTVTAGIRFLAPHIGRAGRAMKQLVCLRARVDAGVYICAAIVLFIVWWGILFTLVAPTEHWPWILSEIFAATRLAIMLGAMYLGLALHFARLRDAGYRWWAFWVWPCAWFLPSRE